MQSIKTNAAVEKLSFTISPQTTTIGKTIGTNPSFQFMNKSFRLTNCRDK